MSKWVLLYESADNVRSKAPPHFPAHLARLQEFHRRGELLQVGTFADSQRDGSMAIFSSREGAEEFVQGDQFRINGVIRGGLAPPRMERSPCHARHAITDRALASETSPN